MRWRARLRTPCGVECMRRHPRWRWGMALRPSCRNFYGVEAVALQTTIIIITTPAGYGGSEKRKTSNEGRTHSPALLRRPTIYVVGKIWKLWKWKIMKLIKNLKCHWFLKMSIVGKTSKTKHVLASLMCFLSVSRYGDDFWKILNVRVFEKRNHQISWKNHQKLLKIAFAGLWEY